MSPKNNTKEIFLDGIPVGEYESTGDYAKDMETCQNFLKEKGLWKEADIVKVMFNQAQSFAKTANDLYENGLSKTPSDPYSITPFVVNSAFSIEVYLKTIHKIYNQNRQGHALKSLYISLPNKAKNVINEVAKETKAAYKISEDIEFISYLNNLNQAFVEWRYIYEKSSSNKIELLMTIYVMQVLDKTIVRLKSHEA